MNKQPIEIPRFIYYNIDIFANMKPCEYLISWANILIVEIEAFKILSDNAEKTEDSVKIAILQILNVK